jgi:hypothetical protein
MQVREGYVNALGGSFITISRHFKWQKKKESAEIVL